MKNSASVHARWISGANLLAALPDFGLAGFFAISWVAPYSFGSHILKRLELIMLMEFFILHSSAFLGAAMTMPRLRSTRILAVVGLGMVYTMFVGSIALSFGTWWPLVSFWMLLVNRMMAIVLGSRPATGDFGFIVLGWALGSACYLGYAFLTVTASIPRLGVTAAVQAAQPIPGGGVWADQPWRVIAFGTFYYATMAMAKLFGLGAPPGTESRPSLASAPRRGFV
jgi:ribose/xylose/arabinose/galactoside ABC-type transport system permease subunit